MAVDWVRGRKLGEGSFGTVNLAAPVRGSHQFPPLMAVKSCGILNSSLLMNEKLILEDLECCPEIIRCLGDGYSLENGERLYNVLLEYASGGSLADKIKNSEEQGMAEFEVRPYTKALLRGLHYVHRFGYVHCDIKLQNILLVPDGGVKIADFGLAKRAGRQRESVSGCECRGTPLYMSPECVTSGDQEPPADIWALGCTVTEMLTGNPAWQCSDVAALWMRIGLGDEVPEIHESLSEEGKDFLRKCFVKDPSQRWTAEMLLNHPFVSDSNDRQIEGGKFRPSPRCPFDFPDWESFAIRSTASLSSPAYTPKPSSNFWEDSNSGTRPSSTLPAARLRGLSSEQTPDWRVSDDWISVR